MAYICAREFRKQILFKETAYTGLDTVSSNSCVSENKKRTVRRSQAYVTTLTHSGAKELRVRT